MEKDEITLIVQSVIHEELKPINHNLDCINTKLNNHIEHFAYQFTEVKNDVGWLKQILDPKSTSEKDIKNAEKDVKSASEIQWLKWGFKLMVGLLIGESLGILFYIIKSFIKF